MGNTMGDDNSKLDTVINSMIVLIVGVIILCSAAIPVISSQVSFLDSLASTSLLDIQTYEVLIGVAILMAIIGLVIGIIKMYTGKSDR